MGRRYNVKVKKIRGFPNALFRVIVSGAASTTHDVSMEEEYYKELTGGKISPEKLMEKSFDFLLQRESNELILKEFPLYKISDYFPEYEKEIWLII